MVDTNSVWIIVISLLLISIFVFGYYFYIEISQKEKSIYDSLNNRIEELEKSLVMNNNYIRDLDNCSDLDISDYSSESEVDDEEIEKLEEHIVENSISEINEIPKIEHELHELHEMQEIQPEFEEPIDESVKLQSVFSDIKSLLGDSSVIEHPMCKHIILSGKRKGEECGKRVKIDGKCSAHV